jgi:hypothetical protein
MLNPITNQLVLAYRTTSSVEIRSLAAKLDGHDISARIVGDFLDTAGLDVGGMSRKELWVSEQDWAVAKPIIEAWRALHHPADLAAPGLTRREVKIIAGVCVVNSVLALAMGPVAMSALLAGVFSSVILIGIYLGLNKLRRQAAENATSHEF